MIKPIFVGLSLAMLSLCGASMAQAQAQDKSASAQLYTRSLAATCANCHGTDGKAVANSSTGSLAGMDTGYFTAQMKAFQSGARPATIMHQLSKGFSAAQIEVLANYFAAQNK